MMATDLTERELSNIGIREQIPRFLYEIGGNLPEPVWRDEPSIRDDGSTPE